MSSKRSFGYFLSDGVGISFMAEICSGLRVRQATSVFIRSRSSKGIYLHHSVSSLSLIIKPLLVRNTLASEKGTKLSSSFCFSCSCIESDDMKIVFSGVGE